MPNLLRALFVCPEHTRQLVVGGAHASIVFCPVCRATKAETRPLYTHLNRALALRLTCEKLAELVRLDQDLVDEIVTACQREADAAQRPDPEVERRLRTKLEKIRKTIDFNRRNPGETDEEQAATTRLLKQLNGERVRSKPNSARSRRPKTASSCRRRRSRSAQMLSELGDIFTKAANSRTDAQLGQARRIIELLTGGRIELFQMGERKARGVGFRADFACGCFRSLSNA